MNLLYNLVAVQPIHSAKFHGGGSYGEVVFRALLKRLYPDSGAAQNEDCRLFCIYDAKKYLSPEIAGACGKYGIPLFDINERTPQEFIDGNAIDTFYTPLYSLEKRWEINVRNFVFTWHGVRALEMRYSGQGVSFAKTISQKAEALVRYRDSWKKYFYLPKYRRLAERIAQGKVRAVTVSEHSRASIRGFFPELMNVEIPVFYSPMSEPDAAKVAECKMPAGVECKKYFLLTSGARWEKNNLRAVMAFDELVTSLKSNGAAFGFKAVVTGATNKKVYTQHLRNGDSFVFLDYVENDDLELLHRNAYAFLFPSLNEGFGYPPMESMRYGVPVAASGTTSVPEICGDAALYFDPYSVSEIKNRIIQLLDPRIYGDYAARAVRRYAEVSARQKTDLEKTVGYILGKG